MAPHSSSARIAPWAFTGAMAMFLTTPLLAAPPREATAAEPAGAYFLFEGIEISALHDGAYQRVVGVGRKSVELRAGPKTTTVPVRQLQGYRTKPDPKFSPWRVTIDNLRATSLRIAVDREMAELELGASSFIRRQEYDLEREKGDLLISQLALGSRPTDAARETRIGEETANIENLRDVVSDYTRNRADDLQRTAPEPGFTPDSTRPLPFDYDHDSLADGIVLKGVIASPHPVEDAFLAVTVSYVVDRQPLKRRQAFELQPVGRLGKKPRKVTVEIRNLPRGFHLLDCRLNFYGGGQEVATNLSKNQVAMTEPQLYAHFLHLYLTQNRAATRPPQGLLFARHDEVRREIKPTELQQEIHVRTDPRGLVVSLSADAAGTRPAPPTLLAAMRFVRFLPGLQDGTAIEGRLAFKLFDLLD